MPKEKELLPEKERPQRREKKIPKIFSEEGEERLLKSFLSSPFIAASLPLKDVNKNIFKRRYNNFALSLASTADKVPFGKYGRLLLTILTTHAVVGKHSADDGGVLIQYDSIRQLLKEMQLSSGRSNEIKKQLDYFSKSTFVFEEKRTSVVQKSLFKDLLENDGIPASSGKIQATLVSSGVIPFIEAMQYIELKEADREGKQFCISMKLSPAFVKFSKKHAVPINYTVYKNISSAVGKDIYAWLVYRNNSLKERETVFIPSGILVEQFMPVRDGSHLNQERTNYNYILDQIRLIKDRYYPDLNIRVNSDGDGITLLKSGPQLPSENFRYVLVTADA